MKQNSIRTGCSSKPLLSYLKALGILRLVSNPENNVNEVAADSHIRGWWVNQQFHINTSLNSEELVEFFLYNYSPSAVIAPWNGGSGFYKESQKEAVNSLLAPSISPRFRTLATAVEQANAVVKQLGLEEAPKNEGKRALIAGLRNTFPDSVLDWLDASLVLSGDTLKFPQILGTGGNDGNLEFTINFHQRLLSNENSKQLKGLFDVTTGLPTSEANRLLRNSLFDDCTYGFNPSAVGQFDPGAVGGPNSISDSFDTKSKVNPWDYVLSIEGAIMFAGAATRRHQASKNAGASFPFTVRMTGAGSGNISSSDENNARAEFWAPLWNQPSSYSELRRLLKEGRAVLQEKIASDGLDFARAVASLGINRGIDSFQRYGFVMRSGKAYLATPIGVRKVSSPSANSASLIDDLDTGDWLNRVRKLAKDENSSSRGAVSFQRLENALFAMSEKTNFSPQPVQLALEALGELVEWLQYNKEVVENKQMPPPPPRLSRAWQRICDDNTPEFRIASALASLGWQTPKSREASTEGELPSTKRSIPMAAHIAPVEIGSIFRRYRSWDTQSRCFLDVWRGSDLESILVSVLNRRLIEQSMDKSEVKQLYGLSNVRLSDIEAFFSPTFDDARCLRLLAGLVWTEPVNIFDKQKLDSHSKVVPFSYAVLKLLFSPSDTIQYCKNANLLPPDCEIPIPAKIIPRLRSGYIDETIETALQRLRASNVPTPFHSSRVKHIGVTGRRLAASLLIPLNNFESKILLQRVCDVEEIQNI